MGSDGYRCGYIMRYLQVYPHYCLTCTHVTLQSVFHTMGCGVHSSTPNEKVFEYHFRYRKLQKYLIVRLSLNQVPTPLCNYLCEMVLVWNIFMQHLTFIVFIAYKSGLNN